MFQTGFNGFDLQVARSCINELRDSSLYLPLAGVAADPESDAWRFVIEELDAGLFKHGYDPGKRLGSRPHRAVEVFHPLDGAKRNLGFAPQISLRPAEQRTGGPNLPSSYYDHGWTLPRSAT